MIRFNWFALLLSCVSLFSFAQQITGIPYCFDADGNVQQYQITGQFYTPENLVEVNLREAEWSKGVIYHKDGSNLEAEISFTENAIYYRKKEGGLRRFVSQNKIKAITTVRDSFFVAPTENVEFAHFKLFRESRLFLHNIGMTKNFSFATDYKLQGNNATELEELLSDKKPVKYFYFLKVNGTERWYEIPRNQIRFNEFCEVFLKGIEGLESFKQKTSLADADVLLLIDYIQKYEAFKTQKFLYYDTYWNRSFKSADTVNKAFVSDLNDSTITIDYFEKGQKTSSVTHEISTSFVKHGYSYEYFSSGALRRKVLFNVGKITTEEIYSPYGQLQYQIDHNIGVKKTLTPYGDYEYERYHHKYFKAVSLGDSTTESFVDSATMCTIVNEFRKDELLYSYKMVDNKRIYLYSKDNKKLPLNKIERRLGKWVNFEGLFQVPKENIDATIWVHFALNENGSVDKMKLLNTVDYEIDGLLMRFLDCKCSKNDMRFKPMKVDKQKVAFEVIVPFRFRVNSFYDEEYKHEKAPFPFYFGVPDHFYFDMFPPFHHY